MLETELRALFLLAGIPIVDAWKTENGYHGAVQPDDSAERIVYLLNHPWWLVMTEIGIVRIGWRKRVIAIDWSSTSLRKEITNDDVTKSDKDVHAWGYSKAVEYLTTWHRHAVHQHWREQNPEKAREQDEQRAEFDRQELARKEAADRATEFKDAK
jgi:hypothetical protein